MRKIFKHTSKNFFLSGFLVIIAACSESAISPNEPITPSATNTPVPSQATITGKQASRFLTQATFGGTAEEITSLQQGNFSQWMISQLALEPSLHLEPLRAKAAVGLDVEGREASDSFWEAAVVAPDQLRQRMAYALSQILVASDGGSSDLRNQPLTMAHYMDTLTQGAFGNYRDLLEEITYSPAMAVYLTYLRNEKADPDKGRVPDENYARELMQLFTIGLVQLNSDGTPQAGSAETYDNEDVIGLAKVFTGLGEKGGFRRNQADDDGLFSRLVTYPEFHSTEEKVFLGTTIPAGTGPEQSIDMALDALFNHQNMAPFLSRQLIQRFVTSNPTPAYIGRVSSAFEHGAFRLPDGQSVGDGRRGDLSATLAAILFDTEAQQTPSTSTTSFGKIREPVLRFIHWARAFNVKSAKAGEEFMLRDTSASNQLAQHPFKSPSVFNFYRPGYVANGTETGAANLTAPELQIVNESSIIGYTNFMSRYVRDDTSNVNGSSGDAFSPDYSTELALADTPTDLVAHLDLILTYEEMAEETKQRIVDALNEMPIRDDGNAEEDRERRVFMAVQMVITSPEFSVQI